MQSNQGAPVRSSRLIASLAAVCVLAIGVAACGSSSSSSNTNGGGKKSGGTINGAGSTFAAPIYQQWGSTLKSQTGLTVNYQAVGSGQGITELTAGTVDFAGSDPPMKPEEIVAAQKKGDPLHFPMALGAITVSYNLSGVKAGMKLTGPVIGDIFLGKVKKWNDPEITKLNPGVSLPSTDITVVHRSDSSGTTKGFTGYLAAVNPTWSKQVGSDKTVKWPTGTGAKGNDGVAAAVKQTPGAVGYVEQAYALQNKFTTAAVQNKAGNYVAPTLQSTTAAGEGLTVPSNLQFTINNPGNPQAYPITSQTFVITYQDLCKAGASQSVANGIKSFLDYAYGAGQSSLQELQYAKLPAAIESKGKAQVSKLQCNGKPLTAT
jgi:phosphate transport system substrate-binding protein